MNTYGLLPALNRRFMGLPQVFCGLDCGECEAYVATQKNDRAGLEPAAAGNSVIQLINAALRLGQTTLPSHAGKEGWEFPGL